MLFEFIVETPKQKGKRKKQKSSESDEGTHIVAERFCFIEPISYYQDRMKRQDETVVKQPRPQGLLSFFQFISGKPREEGLLFSSLRPPYCDTRRPWERGQAVSAALSMARTGLEKSLKKHHVLEKSLDFPQKSLNIFESSLNKITFVKKKVFCVKERMKAQQYANFLGCHESVFSCYFNVPGIVYFPLFEVPKEPCLPGGRYCNKQTPHHLRI